jgi:hypothetical protein
MPPRRSIVSRAKVFPSSAKALRLRGKDADVPEHDIEMKREPLLNRLVKKLYSLLMLYEKVNGHVFAYLCFLTIFSLVVRDTQGGDDKVYLMVQNIVGQVEGGFDSTNYLEYPVTGKKNFAIRDIGNLDDFWEWINPGQFIGIFFPESWCVCHT